jgi:3-hydroxybutyryl-CoA dehydrogenase
MPLAGFKKAGVVGAGQMGGGIAQVCATFGLPVTLVDINADQLERAKATMAASLEKLESKEVVAKGSRDKALSLLSLSTNLESLIDSDVVIEAVIEKESMKIELLQKLDAICDSGSILASNTSSIPITRLAAATKRPAQVIGMHFSV